jgi:hypothetical protein
MDADSELAEVVPKTVAVLDHSALTSSAEKQTHSFPADHQCSPEVGMTG